MVPLTSPLKSARLEIHTAIERACGGWTKRGALSCYGSIKPIAQDNASSPSCAKRATTTPGPGQHVRQLPSSCLPFSLPHIASCPEPPGSTAHLGKRKYDTGGPHRCQLSCTGPLSEANRVHHVPRMHQIQERGYNTRGRNLEACVRGGVCSRAVQDKGMQGSARRASGSMHAREAETSQGMPTCSHGPLALPARLPAPLPALLPAPLHAPLKGC